MKKNGFTLVELLAVLVILAILGGLAAPNIIHLMQSGKEKSFVEDVEEMVSTATYMYKGMYARNPSIGITEYKLYMNTLNGNIPDTDPYGYEYKKESSYVSFKEPAETEANGKRTIKVFFKACKKDDENKCHYICTDDGFNIKNDDIKDKESDCNM